MLSGSGPTWISPRIGRSAVAAARRWETVAVGLLLGGGLWLRLQSYPNSPDLNADEYDWAWTGLTLIRNRVPTGWTDLWSTYGHWTNFTWQRHEYALVTPYLDHPPLFSLLVGGISWLFGARLLTDVSLATIRLIPISLSIAAAFLAFLLARKVVGLGASLVGLVALMAGPAAVALDRVVESESLLAILLLSALLSLVRLERNPRDRVALVVLVGACALAPLTKVPGVAVGFAAVLVLIARRDWSLGLVVVSATVVGLLAFAAYGALLDWQLFVHVWQAQADRHSGFQAGYTFLQAGTEGDWLWALGLIGLAFLILGRHHGAPLLAWPVAAYAVVMAMAANNDNARFYDWYRLALYPLVYMGVGIVFAELGRRVFGFVSGAPRPRLTWLQR